ncbi:hypothetical protein AMK26_14170 [Streptomyces sp. CB03234]|uniref:hypothetical protein n=1 Tax=Streptomyces sp. (strain CB03234) TaxID=1703937 RepID=UPI00093D612D|nr:hypothetical protein [Streptomyces sp. CB03234]OKK04489.1 hypothetical protein AMK26_14170 [Streptomyces sp. CB03234]
MKKILEVIGTLVLVVGVCGVLRELTGWFRFMGFTRYLTENVGFLHGRELFANIVIAVVGFAVLMIADGLRKA